jgi:hypothetical protein
MDQAAFLKSTIKAHLMAYRIIAGRRFVALLDGYAAPPEVHVIARSRQGILARRLIVPDTQLPAAVTSEWIVAALKAGHGETVRDLRKTARLLGLAGDAGPGFPDHSLHLLRMFGVTTPEEKAVLDRVSDQALEAQITSGMHRAGWDPVRAYPDWIDHDLINVLDAAEGWRDDHYRFYTSAEGEPATYRRQAAQVYPMLSPVFASPTNPRLRRTIDGGERLNETLCWRFGLQDGHLKWFRRPTTQSLDGVLSLDDFLATIRDIPLSWVPKSQDDWDACVDLLAALPDFKAVTGQETAVLLNGCGGRWQAFLKAMVESTSVGVDNPGLVTDRAARRQALVQGTHAIGGLTRSYTDTVTLPMVAWIADQEGLRDFTWSVADEEVMHDVSRQMLFNGKAAPACLENARRYEHHEVTIRGAIDAMANPEGKMQEADQDTWMPLTPPMRAPNGLWLVPLTTTEDLTHEGRVMDHCVGGGYIDGRSFEGWTRKCRNNGLHIVSVRTEAGRSLATIEFGNFDQGLQNWEMKQFQGYKNNTPGAAERKAMEWYRDSIKGGRIPVDLEAHQEFRRTGLMRFDTDEVTRRCQYRWRDDGVQNIAVAFGIWASKITNVAGNEIPSFLPKSVRKQGATKLAHSRLVRTAVAHFAPWIDLDRPSYKPKAPSTEAVPDPREPGPGGQGGAEAAHHPECPDLAPAV